MISPTTPRATTPPTPKVKKSGKALLAVLGVILLAFASLIYIPIWLSSGDDSNKPNPEQGAATGGNPGILDVLFSTTGIIIGVAIIALFLAVVVTGARSHWFDKESKGAKHAVTLLAVIAFVIALTLISLFVIFEGDTGEVIDTYRAQLAEKIDPRPGGTQNQTPQNKSSGTGGTGGGTQNLNSAPTNTPDRIDETLAWLEETAEEISIRDIVRSWWIWLFVPIVYFWSWIRYNRAQSRLSMKGDFDWFGNLMRALGPAGLVAVLVMGLKAVTIWA